MVRYMLEDETTENDVTDIPNFSTVRVGGFVRAGGGAIEVVVETVLVSNGMKAFVPFLPVAFFTIQNTPCRPYSIRGEGQRVDYLAGGWQQSTGMPAGIRSGSGCRSSEP